MANNTTPKTLKEKLFDFQKLGIVVERNAKGFNYKYASYDYIWSKIGEILNEFRLLVSHHIQDYGGILYLETTIFDLDSQEFRNSQIPISATTPQTMGSAITYYKRYNLAALLNLIIEDEDDDGAAAERKVAQKKPAQAPQAKEKFLDENFENFKKWTQGKTLEQIVTQKDEILSKRIVSEEMSQKLEDFLLTFGE